MIFLFCKGILFLYKYLLVFCKEKKYVYLDLSFCLFDGLIFLIMVLIIFFLKLEVCFEFLEC